MSLMLKLKLGTNHLFINFKTNPPTRCCVGFMQYGGLAMSALMFQRLAHSFMKNGYYPTDSETMSRIINALQPAEDGTMNIIDPCAGEGTALAECQHSLGSTHVNSFAIEYDKERAWHAKSLLDHCIHGDLQDCLIAQRQFGLLFLNPPYGDMVADKAGLSSHEGGKQRLEKLFYQKSNAMLQFGGVMVLILPHYTLDKELSNWIARHFERVQIFMAPEQQFKQVVILGVRRRVTDISNTTAVASKLQAVGKGDLPEELPETWSDDLYQVPANQSGKEIKFVYTKLDAAQLEKELQHNRGIWHQFDLHFGQQIREPRRPLCRMTDWHLALALAAGQVSGVVKSKDGRFYVIKGDTYKDRTRETKTTIDDNNDVIETRTVTDKFVPAIRALDVTPGSSTLGEAYVIQ